MKQLLRSGPLLQLSWFVALSTLVPLALGILLDRRFGTAPLFILVGAAVGIIASTVGAVRIASRAIDALGHENLHPAEPLDESDEGKED
jgi:F0F1-type ATP synthase assembly protein I